MQLATSTLPSRELGRRSVLARPEMGFLGPGHQAVQVVGPDEFEANDPFVLLMDDRIDFADGQKIGEAHPHAGLETVTFVIEGRLVDRDEGTLGAGDLVWMTAGRGIVHSENVFASGTPSRVLQLWLTLPERARQAPPRFEVVRGADVPVHRSPGVEAHLYSGSTHGLTSTTRNHVPITLIDVRLAPGARFEHALPASYNGFLVPIAGDVRVGERAEELAVGEVGWLDHTDAQSRLELVAGAEGARVVVYAGERQNEPMVQRGPFVAGSEGAITQMFRDYRARRFVPLSQIERG